jgi:hypothetical protein
MTNPEQSNKAYQAFVAEIFATVDDADTRNRLIGLASKWVNAENVEAQDE